MAQSNGQPYYPIYIFGPYKLVAVAAGCAISFFWVIFPYPITARSKVPRLAGQNLFNLARIYSAMHATVELWMNIQHRIPSDLTYQRSQLIATLRKLDKEELLSLDTLRTHSQFARYEPPVGGKFPTQIYGDMISGIQRTSSMMALMAHIGSNMPSATSGIDNVSEQTDDWMSHLRAAALKSVDFQSHSTTSLLCHFGSAMMNSHPLPPFLSVPESFPLARQLQRLELDLPHNDNTQYPMFMAFISLEILRTMLNFELENLLE